MAETTKNKGMGTQNQGNADRDQHNKQGGSQGGQGGQSNQGNQGAMAGVTHFAKDAASSISQTAGNMASTVADQAQNAASTVAGGMHSLAGSIRENAPSTGMLHSAAEGVAGTLDSSGRYLEQEGFSGMMDDMVGMVRRNPIPCALTCVGVGFVLGWLMTSSSTSSRSY
jgi:hypothetical protein